jgi:hypothetical protein
MIQVQDGQAFGSLQQMIMLKLKKIILQEWLEQKCTVINAKLILGMFFLMALNLQA